MSCDGNRAKYFAHVAHEKSVLETFGSEAEAASALEQIFNTARAQATPTDRSLS